ncbi:hypothetical protein JZ751_029751 [Albula glossodonta]|uniref:Uncharacterized protein n=1 Tax=Albula glossodonta TaxID=121402 RepID=A0A8T2ND07_9TELE|nr:hypothetical protein JZ751_029751 [Albula glossodonta]
MFVCAVKTESVSLRMVGVPHSPRRCAAHFQLTVPASGQHPAMRIQLLSEATSSLSRRAPLFAGESPPVLLNGDDSSHFDRLITRRLPFRTGDETKNRYRAAQLPKLAGIAGEQDGPTEFLDHLLTGIEDICGHYGHHHWKDK